MSAALNPSPPPILLWAAFFSGSKADTLLKVDLEWESQNEDNPVEDFTVPAYYSNYTTKDMSWLEGKRYFSRTGSLKVKLGRCAREIIVSTGRGVRKTETEGAKQKKAETIAIHLPPNKPHSCRKSNIMRNVGFVKI